MIKQWLYCIYCIVSCCLSFIAITDLFDKFIILCFLVCEQVCISKFKIYVKSIYVFKLKYGVDRMLNECYMYIFYAFGSDGLKLFW